MMKNQKDFEKEIGFSFDVVDKEFKDGKVFIHIESYDGKSKTTVSRPLHFVSREKAMSLTGIDNPRVRDYELEMDMHLKLDCGYFIKGICPINGFSGCPEKYWK